VVRVPQRVFDAASRVVGDDTEMREALGLDAYWGFDTKAGTQRGKKVKSLRAPEVVPDDEWDAEQEALRTGQPVSRGFNNYNRRAG
jgi:hypothetical protein